MTAKSNDTDLKDLLKDVGCGKLQLPEFQRSWVWDDTRICKLLESLLSSFPMGAVLNLEHGGEDIHFKYRLFTGVNKQYETVVPNGLILDGQQRLTTLYQALCCQSPVQTCLPTNRDSKIERYYYINMRDIVADDSDVLDCILSIPADKKLKENIGRDIKLDLSTRALEIENCYFPVNLIYDPMETNLWQMEYMKYYSDSTMQQMYFTFMLRFLNPLQNYKLPVIQLSKDTKKEAVCQIFENVNTGGVPLTVFELVTAIYASEGHDLRKDWEDIKADFKQLKVNLLKNLEPHYFLMAMSLLVSYQKGVTVTCKKRDILKMEYLDYKQNRDILVQGFKDAANFIVHLGIYSTRNIPYETQLIPLASIFAYDNSHDKLLNLPNSKGLLAQWYWCGVFGELYGGANETRFANDMANIFRWFSGGAQPDTVVRASFNATRLLSLYTRNSAAYKGVMALITMDKPLDFMTGQDMNIASYLDESTDIHHIYPESQCITAKYPINRWNTVINKTPIYASSNRSIGGRLPSQYTRVMANKGLSDEKIAEILHSHKINPELLCSDDFFAYTKNRATQLLDRIEKAMGKAVDGRDSEEIIKEFGSNI
ncbi:MAG: DUF262 domain-containing protein [Paludibacteraceae bacterium]|nr:DUF262 domain-containing protein [Paludibacteraceae bacterium]